MAVTQSQKTCSPAVAPMLPLLPILLQQGASRSSTSTLARGVLTGSCTTPSTSRCNGMEWDWSRRVEVTSGFEPL